MTDQTSSPLDAERARLRAKGFSDQEASQILMDREKSASQTSLTTSAANVGGMSGILFSIIAYVASSFTAIRNDFIALRHAPTLTARRQAGISLAFKVAVVSAITFAGWREWNRHIIYEPETARQQTINLTEQANHAPERERAISASAAAQATINEATAAETLRRQKAEADEAVARACNARMEQLKQNVSSDDLIAGGGIKSGSRTARMLEAYDKDCNRLPNESASATREARAPANMEHAKTCDEQFKALLNEIQHNIDANNFDALDKMSDRLVANRSECPMTDAQREEGRVLGQAVAAKLEAKTKADREALLAVRAKARAAIGAEDWQEAYELSLLYAKAAEPFERDHPGRLTEESLAIQALGALFTHRFEAARSAAERAYGIRHTSVMRLAQANALLLLGRTDEAKSIFRAGTDDESPAEWNRSLSENLKTLRSLGLPQPVLNEIEKVLSNASPAEVTTTPPAPTRGLTSSTPVERSVPAEPSVPAPPALIIPNSYRRRLTSDDLTTLSPTALRMARNEIFARNGLYFHDAELSKRFEQYSWYRPFTWDIETLSPIERDNVNLLAQAARNR